MAQSEDEPENMPEIVQARNANPEKYPAEDEDPANSGQGAQLALVVWLCGFLLLLAFLIWGSVVEIIRWLAG